MVLKPLRWIALVCLLSGCVTARPAATQPERVQWVAAVVVDAEDGTPVQPPDAMLERLRQEFLHRNIALTFRPLSASPRLTQARLQSLARESGSASGVLLVEARAVFYSLLTGRFRWNVTTRTSLARPDAVSTPLTDEGSHAVFLDFDFQKETEAFEDAAPRIARNAARLADELNATPLPTPRAAAVGPDDSVYFVLVDRFRNGDRSNDADANPADPQAFHGGDLQGVLDGLDQIQRQGFTTVWLSPVTKMRTRPFESHGAFHGYWTEDLTRVEPRFGDEALLAKLSDELHRRGMKLVLDLVLNHVGYDAPLLAQHPDWFHRRGSIRNWNDATELTDGEVHGLPDLAQENEAVTRHLIDAAKGWVDRVHPDGFRLDAVKHVPLAFWKRFNTALRAHAGASFWLLGEAYDGDPVGLEETLEAGGFSALFNFPLYFATIDVFCRGRSPALLGAMLEAQGARRAPFPYVNLVDNHDLPRLASQCSPDQREAALTFLFAAPGVPSVSYGTELAQSGRREPENRADFDWGAPQQLRGTIAGGLDSRRSRPLSAIRLEGDVLEVGFGERAFRIAPGRIETIPPLPPQQLAPLSQPVRVEGAPPHVRDVRVVGLGESLGGWRPESGVPLTRSSEIFEGALPLQSGALYQFKLVARTADEKWVWESGDDRFLQAGPQRVDLIWRS